MDREILFRGKRVDNGEWTEGFYCKSYGRSYGINYDYHSLYDYEAREHYEIIPEMRGEYTGLTDKNGKKIFEGDIIECDSERFIIVWDTDFAGFYLDDIDPDYEGCAGIDDVSKDGYVIGNIHDNPEMLKGGIAWE